MKAEKFITYKCAIKCARKWFVYNEDVKKNLMCLEIWLRPKIFIGSLFFLKILVFVSNIVFI